MSHEKRYTAKQAAQAVLAKTQELLAKSELIKAMNNNTSPAPATPAPMLAMSENPDKSADAKLGEDVEHLCEEHMMENKAAERKEGHKIVKSEDCIKCKSNIPKPSVKSGQGEHHSPHGAKMEWQMDKSEMFSDLAGEFAQLEEMFKGETKHDRCVEHVKENSPGVKNPHAVCVAEGVKPSKWGKSEDEGVGSKKIGYKPSKEGENEKEPQKEDKAFQEEGMDHKSSDDPRMAEQESPSKNPKEEAEGNNELPGTTPNKVGQDGKNMPGYDEIKGHLKLAKFIGRMEHKRALKKASAAPMDKVDQYDSQVHQKGVHHGVPTKETAGTAHSYGSSMSGGSKAGNKRVLSELKAMPKPKLPR